METFALVSGLASILGLGASLWAVAEVRRLRNRYVRQGMLPQLVDRLGDHASALTSLLDSVGDDTASVDAETARLKATIAALIDLGGQGNKQSFERVQSRVLGSLPLRTRDRVQSVRAEVYFLIETVKLSTEQERWA